MTFRPLGGAPPRWIAALLLVLAWAGAAVVLSAGPASAHAELVGASPASGAALDRAPTQLRLDFSEGVTQIPSALRLLGSDGAPAALGASKVVGHTLTVELPGPLADGGYVFVYRVISADSHPVGGAVTFTVGADATAADAAAVAAAVGPAGDSLVSALGGANRWASYLGVVLLLGVPAFVGLCRPAAVADPVLRALTVAGAALVALTALGSLPLQAARSAGTGLSGAFSDGVMDATLHTAYGECALARVLLVAVGLGALWAAVRLNSVRALGLAGAAAAAMLFTFSRSGHPAVGAHPALTMVLDAAHLAAVAVWLGGLVVLALRVLPAPAADCPDTLARWSPVAMSAVAVLVVTGSAQAWRELRSVDAVIESSYGRLVLLKVVGLVLRLALGEMGRRQVRQLSAPAPLMSASLGAALAERPADSTAALRRSVGLELGLAGAVLAATAALVVTTPGVHAGHSSGHAGHAGHSAAAEVTPAQVPAPTAKRSAPAVTGSVELPNDVRVEVTADPASAGAAILTIRTLNLSGDPLDAPEVTVTAALAEAGIAPITLTAIRSEPGRYTVDGTSLILPGTWKITVTVRTTEIDAGVGSVEMALT
jgi:copper transport protein